jgi:ABC-2 type transport system ATP-binding protein
MGLELAALQRATRTRPALSHTEANPSKDGSLKPMSDVVGAAAASTPYRSPPVTPARATPPSAIECEGLVHSFGSKLVLRGVSFQVPRGSIYGFIGPNGAGKTTTLRILATLLEPTSGTARIAGHDVTSHPERVRRILGYMPDSPVVYERVTVGEYLDFFASALDMHGEARARAVNRVLDLTDMGPLRAIHVTTLSKGQKQRLLLARTLLHDPEVLVLDEPASDLDPRARIELRTLLGALGRTGKTILLSSHILTELAELCDAIAVLEGGRIVVSGPIDEVRAKVRPGRRLRLRVLARAEEASTVLRGCASVRAVDAVDAERGERSERSEQDAERDAQRDRGATLEVTHDGDEWAVAELVSALAKAQIPVGAVEPERADLERIFMDVTNRAAQAAKEGAPPLTLPSRPVSPRGATR